MRNSKLKISSFFERNTILIMFLIGIFVISIVGFNSLARISKQAETQNIIESGEIDVELLNETNNGERMPLLVTHIVPGDTLDNKVTIRNSCLQDEYIRVSLSKTIYETIDSKETLDSEKAEFLFNEEDWTYKDGYYYYNHILPAGEISEFLYNGIYLSPTMGNEYKTAVLQVDILVEAVQSVNNGKSVFEAEGWEVITQ